RGRPRLVYTVHPSAESRWGVMGPYERLSHWLAEMVRTGDTPVEVGRRAGRDQPVEAAAAEAPAQELARQMALQGFDPSVRTRRASIDIELRTCPFAST